MNHRDNKSNVTFKKSSILFFLYNIQNKAYENNNNSVMYKSPITLTFTKQSDEMIKHKANSSLLFILLWPAKKNSLQSDYSIKLT